MPGEKQESLVSLKDGMIVGLTIIFSLSRTVQIWSRLPGTTGDWFYGWMFAVGIAISAWYYELNVQASQAIDFIEWRAMAILSGMWFGVHGVVRAIRQLQGVRFHSYEPGVGVLDRFLSRIAPQYAGVISDIATAFALGVVFRCMGCPIQSGWYFAMCFWIAIGNAWIVARDSRRKQMWVDSQVEATEWSHRIK